MNCDRCQFLHTASWDSEIPRRCYRHGSGIWSDAMAERTGGLANQCGPLARHFAQATDPAPMDPAPPAAPYPILKDTIVQRMKSAGLLGNLAAMVGSLPPEDRFEFDQSSWFSSTNPRIRYGITACGGDPSIILAPDPLAPESRA